MYSLLLYSRVRTSQLPILTANQRNVYRNDAVLQKLISDKKTSGIVNQSFQIICSNLLRANSVEGEVKDLLRFLYLVIRKKSS